ncbi:MAG TPA: FAD-dependent oxidoreductase [Rubricoccaceae bacterium]|nr:FAD-dependent oxidoreductase [Rubricoccaceae bacterium]
MDERFDCIIVGGGIAGLSAAMALARADARFLLIERGEWSGAKNVSGGVLWGTDLARLVPNYWEDPEPGWERYVGRRRLTFMDERSAFSLDFASAHFAETPYTGLTVLRSRFDRWLAGKVEEAVAQSAVADASFLAQNILVEEVLMEDGRAVGIRAGEERFFADCVILAEGVNNLLTRQAGLQTAYVPAEGLAVGVKEVIRFDRKVLEDRFQLSEKSGMSNEFVGFATGGVEGGGFLYTNRDSVSVGLVLGMADLRAKGGTPYDLLNQFKAHPVVADQLRGGEVVEYSAKVVSTGDMRVMPKEVYADGLLVAGEAANLVLNAGRAIQGMDYAMRSGLLAAETVIEAKRAGDFSAGFLRNYRTALENSYVMQDLRGFQGAVAVLHDPAMFTSVPRLVCDFGRAFFTVDNRPTRKAYQILRDVRKAHMSYWDLVKLGARAARSL